MKPILDPCCGSRMFYFDKKNPLVAFGDNRTLETTLKDSSKKSGERLLKIEPDITLDFRDLPYLNEEFSLVIFDPPHLIKVGDKSWLALKYGKLNNDWKEDIKKGFEECFRILKTNGTLIFKWNERDIPLKEILKLSPIEPLIGQITTQNRLTHWIVFFKEDLDNEQ